MALYVCIVLKKSTPLEVREIEADDVAEATDTALVLCRDNPTCTTYELWRNGKKVHTGAPETH